MESILKVLNVALVASLAAASIGCVIDVEGFEATEEDQRVFSVSGTPDVTLSTFDGPIVVEGWDRPEVRVVIEKRGANADALENIEIQAEQSGNTIRVAAIERDRRGFAVTVSISSWRGAKLVASVPREANLVAATDDGSVTIENVKGVIELRTNDGRIRGFGLAGAVTAETDDGSVYLEEVDGRVDARTDDGSLEVSGRLNGVRLRTDDGRVRVGVTRDSAMAADWDIETDDGRVTLALPAGFSADLDARTQDGRVLVDDVFGGGAGAEGTLRYTIGDGGHTLRVRSGEGTIRIEES